MGSMSQERLKPMLSFQLVYYFKKNTPNVKLLTWAQNTFSRTTFIVIVKQMHISSTFKQLLVHEILNAIKFNWLSFVSSIIWYDVLCTHLINTLNQNVNCLPVVVFNCEKLNLLSNAVLQSLISHYHLLQNLESAERRL